ncbi:putative gustatory receptor 28b isoform X4 [Bactrocera neohumeralis]|uniref:putative gustatory receptor 28b isoform X4 n=1 Tax=Bactrocera neohumeralis TaxID=98809 RepID=UPI002165D3BD|nr:putative gustatory receptor 28b isoform X4 [Bactrocera neohumeralis]
MFVLRRTLTHLNSNDEYYTAIQPLFGITHLLGVSSYVVVTNKRGVKSLANSRFSYIVLILNLAVIVYCGVCIIRSKSTFVGNFMDSDYTAVFEKVVSPLICTANVNILIRNFAGGQQLHWLIKHFLKIDRKSGRIGIQWNYRKVFYGEIRRLMYIVSQFSITLIINIICSYRLNAFPTLQLSYVILSVMIVLQFTIFLCDFLMMSTGVRLQALNEVLKKLAHQWDNSIVKPMPKQRSLQCLDSFSMYTIVTNNPCEIIQESMEIHHMICDAASTANKYFTYQLLTIISIAFLIIVFDAYYVLETLLGKSAHESKFKTVEFVTFFSCQMILYVIAIISIVEGSNRAIKKSEKTGGIVHSLLNKAKNAELKEKLQQFSLQLLHLKIHFTAAGLFNIDRTLYFTISGALTTYLIILLQFTNSNAPERPFAPMEENDTMPIRSLVSNLTVAG